jgi:hypothetical protein
MFGVEGFETPERDREEVRLRHDADKERDQNKYCRSCDDNDRCGLTPGGWVCRQRRHESAAGAI